MKIRLYFARNYIILLVCMNDLMNELINERKNELINE